MKLIQKNYENTIIIQKSKIIIDKSHKMPYHRSQMAGMPACRRRTRYRFQERKGYLMKNYKFWFATGSQDLYGDQCLAKVAEHSRIIVEEINKSGLLPYEVVWKPTLLTNEMIRGLFNEANMDGECAGSSLGCTPSPLPSPGSWGCRSTASRCAIYIPSSTWRFPTTPSTWIS